MYSLPLPSLPFPYHTISVPYPTLPHPSMALLPYWVQFSIRQAYLLLSGCKVFWSDDFAVNGAVTCPTGAVLNDSIWPVMIVYPELLCLLLMFLYITSPYVLNIPYCHLIFGKIKQVWHFHQAFTNILSSPPQFDNFYHIFN